MMDPNLTSFDAERFILEKKLRKAAVDLLNHMGCVKYRAKYDDVKIRIGRPETPTDSQAPP